MIATIATVCLAASAAANPETTASPEGRQLIGYTQSLGEPCGLFGTGKCVVGQNWIDSALSQEGTDELSGRKLANPTNIRPGRKLAVQNTLGGKCDLVTSCGHDMACANSNPLFGHGFCILM